MNRRSLHLVVAMAALVFASEASAAKIKRLTFGADKSGAHVDLTFDTPYSAKYITWAQERNFAQFVVKNSAIDTSRIHRLQNSGLEKVMVYPFNSDTVRVRFIAAEKVDFGFQAKNINDRTIRVSVQASTSRADTPKRPEANERAGADEELLREVVANTREIDISNPDSIKAAIIQKTPSSTGTPESGAIGSAGEPSRPFLRMALGLLAVLGLFGGVVVVLRKYGANKLPFGKKERIIQIVATHYLGSKKSISLVKIAGEYLVVGAANDNINLISKLGPEVNVDKYLEDRFWGGTFENHLKTYAKDVTSNKNPSLEAYDGVKDVLAESKVLNPVAKQSIAAQTKSTVSSVRSGIKERLAQLKDLG
jgi:flagellar biosynthetic protein FliO